jgi:hypothetical protein
VALRCKVNFSLLAPSPRHTGCARSPRPRPHLSCSGVGRVLRECVFAVLTRHGLDHRGFGPEVKQESATRKFCFFVRLSVFSATTRGSSVGGGYATGKALWLLLVWERDRTGGTLMVRSFRAVSARSFCYTFRIIIGFEPIRRHLVSVFVITNTRRWSARRVGTRVA